MWKLIEEWRDGMIIGEGVGILARELGWIIWEEDGMGYWIWDLYYLRKIIGEGVGWNIWEGVGMESRWNIGEGVGWNVEVWFDWEVFRIGNGNEIWMEYWREVEFCIIWNGNWKCDGE